MLLVVIFCLVSSVYFRVLHLLYSHIFPQTLIFWYSYFPFVILETHDCWWETKTHNLISVQCRTRSSSVVNFARPHVSSSCQITNRYYTFRYASPYLWNQLPSLFHQPYPVHFPSGSPHLAHITSSLSSPSLSPSITPSVYHCGRLKACLFHTFFPP